MSIYLGSLNDGFSLKSIADFSYFISFKVWIYCQSGTIRTGSDRKPFKKQLIFYVLQ